MDNEYIYDVKAIIGYRKRKSGVQYKVEWEGFPLSEATWEPVENLEYCKESIEEYHSRNVVSFFCRNSSF